MLDQRRRRWADFVQMLYKCFVFAGHPRKDEASPFIPVIYHRFYTHEYDIIWLMFMEKKAPQCYYNAA